MTLSEFFRKNERIAVALSGGVDSSYLLWAASEAGADVRGYFARSQFQPDFELEDARKIAELAGVPLGVIGVDALEWDGVADNPPDRCYHCKRALFSEIIAEAGRDGYGVVCDGTNASDDAGDRPGMRALRELGVVSPLREAGLGKADIRRLSREAGLPTASKPSYACLATRIPAGEPITPEKLRKISRAEDFLREKGFTNLRVRWYHGIARLQLPENQFAAALRLRGEIAGALSDWDGVALDLIPRDGD